MAVFKSLTNQNTFSLPAGKVIYIFRANEGLNATLDERDVFEYIIYRSKRDAVMIVEPTNRIFLNDSLVSLAKIIHDGDIIKIADDRWQFIEITKESLDERTLAEIKKDCAVCGDEFVSRDEVIQCPSCFSYYHYLCWEYVGGQCPNRMCSYKDHREHKDTNLEQGQHDN